MNPRPGSYKALYDAREKEIALTAYRARLDTLYGGARALVEAEESGDRELLDVVKDVYAQSTGKPSYDWEAWECGECGCTYLGYEEAARCCSEEEFDPPEFEEEA